MASLKNTEIRKLPSGYLDIVTDILEEDEQWKRFMSIIPKDLANLSMDNYEPKYNFEHIRMIENYVRDQRPKVNYAKVLFSEWGTSGRVRPTLASVQALLIKAEMYKAADQIASTLGEPLPRRPEGGPAARIDINLTSLLLDSDTQAMTCNERGNETLEHGNETLEHCNRPTLKVESFNLIHFSKSNNDLPTGESQFIPVNEILNPPSKSEETLSNIIYSESSPTSETIEQPTESLIKKVLNEYTNLIIFSLTDIKLMTSNFSSACGGGVFGDVFRGHHPTLGLIAVKKAHDQKQSKNSFEKTRKMFQSEVNALYKLQHPNIVKMIGISVDSLALCIVCEYIGNGSLKEKIIEKVLTEAQRMKIMMGTASGLKYMHSFEKPNLSVPGSYRKANFIHGDVKSANILLTEDFSPKLCDFGLTEDKSGNTAEQINGTPIYMAPECFSGTIDQKSDVYSYGIVMLEVITGKLAVEYENDHSLTIKEYVKDNVIDNDITPIIDKTVEQWINVQKLFDIATICINEDMTKRLTMGEIHDRLGEI